MVGLGAGLVGAAFMLAWAADAGEAVYSGGLVLAVVALVGVLPEFVIELHLAYVQQAELVTANLTGATRLLLTGATALPLLLAVFGHRTGEPLEPIRLDDHRRVELGILLLAALLGVSVLVRGELTVVDGVLLLGVFVLYARRVRGTAGEQPAVVGVAAGLLELRPALQRPAIALLLLTAGTVVVTVANPFTRALLETGASAGADPYFLIQSVVPAATEIPELITVAVLVANRRPAQGLALLLASSVGEWTLGLGLIPFAYAAGGGGMTLPLAGREQVELWFTTALTLFVVGALITLRPATVDAALVSVIFLAQLVYPTPYVKVASTFVLLVFAVDLLWARRRHLHGLVRVRRPRASGST
jgi:cation:H+ antiporter